MAYQKGTVVYKVYHNYTNQKGTVVYKVCHHYTNQKGTVVYKVYNIKLIGVQIVCIRIFTLKINKSSWSSSEVSSMFP